MIKKYRQKVSIVDGSYDYERNKAKVLLLIDYSFLEKRIRNFLTAPPQYNY